jgi:hypothetical protein
MSSAEELAVQTYDAAQAVMGLASASGLETALKVAKKVYDAVQQVGGVGTRSEISSSEPSPHSARTTSTSSSISN